MTRSRAFQLFPLSLLLAFGCGSSSKDNFSDPASSSGGSTSTGGAGSGGSTSTGGASSGGSTSTGGTSGSAGSAGSSGGTEAGVECSEAIPCADGAKCDLAQQLCVECLSADDCGGSACEQGSCVSAPDNCEGKPSVLVLLQRSGALFELPAPEDNWWNAITAGLTNGGDSIFDQYGESMSLGVQVFHRVTSDENQSCPLISELALGTSSSEVANLLGDEADDQATAMDQLLKIDAPLSETIAHATTTLGSSGRRVIVVITSGLLDTCEVQDSACATDPAIVAAQAAHAAGIELYVLGLGENLTFNYDVMSIPPVGYTGFLQAFANAGRGEAVAGPPYHPCVDSAAGTYAEEGGSAVYYHALATDEVADELGALFGAISACE